MKPISATEALNLRIEAGIKKGLDDVKKDRISPFTIAYAKRLKRKFQEMNS